MHKGVLHNLDGHEVSIETTGGSRTIVGVLDTSQLDHSNTVHVDTREVSPRHTVIDADQITTIEWRTK